MTASDAEMPPAVEPAVLANGGGDAPAPAVTAKDARVAKPPDAGAGAKIAPGGAGDLDAPAAAAATPTSTLEPPAAAPKAWAKGDRVSALATFDRTYHPADVIDVRRAFPEDDHHEGSVSYYVRYAGFDKRLDEWLPGSALEPYTSAVEDALTDDKADLSSPRAGDADTPRASGRKLTRNLKRRYNEINNVAGAVEDLAPIDQKLEKEHDERTKVKNVKVIECGKHEVDAWYFSPYPRDQSSKKEKRNDSATPSASARTGGTDLDDRDVSGAPPPPHVECDKLYVCERCLKYVRKRSTLAKHEAKCEARHPPGKMIYEHKRSGAGADLAFWEIDGAKMKVYCQNLCLLAKLFLDHKTLYFDVEPFLFYVLTELDPETNRHVAVGYFSKEKFSAEEYNLACILTLPPYQRRGYGSLLISMSYELSRREGKVGTPERPLSDLGLVSYRSYWCRVVLAELRRHKASLSLKDLSAATGFREADVASALTSLNLLKYWKGQHIVSATPKIVEDHLKSFGGPDALFAVNPEWVRWEPPPAAPPPANRKGGANGR
jgi:histone acetyltransferase MYST1